MYSIYADGICIYNDTFPLNNMKVINPKLTLEENTAGSLSVTLPASNAGYESVKRLVSDISVQKNGKELWAGRVLSEEMDFWNNRILYCEGELGFLNDSTQPAAQYRGLSVREFLEKLIEIHNNKVSTNRWFQIGIVTVTETDGSLYRYTNHEKTIKYIREMLVNKLGGYLRVRKEGGVRYLDYLAEYPRINSQVIRFGENLLDFTRKWDLSDFSTAIIPLGKQLDKSPIEELDAHLTVESVNNGQLYVHAPEAVAAYGWIEKVVEWNDIDNPASLLRNAQAYLSDNQFETMCIELKALDLHYLKVDSEPVALLDQIRVISPPHGMDRLFPVTKLEIPLDSPENTTFTLGGTVKQSLSDASNRLSWEYRQKLSETRAAIIQTADAIRLEVTNELAGLESSFTVELDKITARVQGTEGRVTTLEITADGLQSQITASNGNIATLTATANTLRTQMTTANGNISTLTQTASSLQSQITTANGNISTLTQTASSLQSQITDNNDALSSRISTIKQTIDNIPLSVSNSGNIASISLSVDGKTKTGKIDLNGYVTFTGLSSGTTTIDGGCIKTGRLSSDLIKLGGTTWLGGCIGVYRDLNGDTRPFKENGESNFDENNNCIGYIGKNERQGFETVSLFGINGAAAHICSSTRVIIYSDYYVDIKGSEIHLNGRSASSLISDRRIKKDIDYQCSERLTHVFDELKPVTFHFDLPNDDGQNHIGFIAQDVADAVGKAGLGDALVAPDCFERYTLNYSELIAILTAKIRQLEKRIEQLSIGVIT